MDTRITQNLNNLHQFWQSMPRIKEGDLYRHTGWPNKLWQQNFEKIDRSSWQHSVSVTHQTPSQDEQIRAQLVAMTLDLTNQVGEKSDKIVQITAETDLDEWADVCSQAFGYQIDVNSLASLLSDKHAFIFSYKLDGKTAGTVIAYQTGSTLGVHQVGVPKEFRGKGIAKALMAHLVWFAKQQNCDLMSLQASKGGLPIYLSMGFTQDFTLTHLAAS